MNTAVVTLPLINIKKNTDTKSKRKKGEIVYYSPIFNMKSINIAIIEIKWSQRSFAPAATWTAKIKWCY